MFNALRYIYIHHISHCFPIVVGLPNYITIHIPIISSLISFKPRFLGGFIGTPTGKGKQTVSTMAWLLSSPPRIQASRHRASDAGDKVLAPSNFCGEKFMATPRDSDGFYKLLYSSRRSLGFRFDISWYIMIHHDISWYIEIVHESYTKQQTWLGDTTLYDVDGSSSTLFDPSEF
jgi:hypothetical protein